MSQCPIMPPLTGDPALSLLAQQVQELQRSLSPANLIEKISQGGGPSGNVVTDADELWLSIVGSTISHDTPQPHSAGAYDFFALTDLSFTGSTMTLEGSNFYCDDRGHRCLASSDPSPSTATNIILVPVLPPHDGNTYALTVKNGSLSWVQVGTC